MKMISKRAIEIKLREMIPEGTHIRHGSIERIQEIVELKTIQLMNKIVDCSIGDNGVVITTTAVNSAFVDIETGLLRRNGE